MVYEPQPFIPTTPMRNPIPVIAVLLASVSASPFLVAATPPGPKISKSDPLYSQKMAVAEAEKALHAAQKARPSKSETIAAAQKKLEDAQKALLDAEKQGHSGSSTTTPATTK